VISSRIINVKNWRAADQHSGIGTFGGSVYTYQPQDGGARPPVSADVYRVETYMKGPSSIHRNVHYIPAARLNAFLVTWCERRETVIDVRPLTMAEARMEIRAFRERPEGVKVGSNGQTRRASR
jgi:hypothetical protein